MSRSPDTVYHDLQIIASRTDTDIWLGDDEGHFVQKATGALRTRLMPGNYVVEFGLGTPTYPVPLPAPASFTQAQLQAGAPCSRPMPLLDSEAT